MSSTFSIRHVPTLHLSKFLSEEIGGHFCSPIYYFVSLSKRTYVLINGSHSIFLLKGELINHIYGTVPPIVFNLLNENGKTSIQLYR